MHITFSSRKFTTIPKTNLHSSRDYKSQKRDDYSLILSEFFTNSTAFDKTAMFSSVRSSKVIFRLNLVTDFESRPWCSMTSARKLWFSISEILTSSSTSIVRRSKILYTLVRSQFIRRANSDTVIPLASKTDFTRHPICIPPLFFTLPAIFATRHKKGVEVNLA